MASKRLNPTELANIVALIRSLDMAENRTAGKLLSNVIKATEKAPIDRSTRGAVTARLEAAESQIEAAIELLITSYKNGGGRYRDDLPRILRESFV